MALADIKVRILKLLQIAFVRYYKNICLLPLMEYCNVVIGPLYVVVLKFQRLTV